ncbi:hypothetical protein N234_31685 [Ralstonia pickettii DTP0602]|nr:hypothetical protein N234_31685 [Ralstonia pickettii DTP0602]
MDASKEESPLPQPLVAYDWKIVGRAIAEMNSAIGAAVRRFEVWLATNGPVIGAAIRRVIEELPPAYREAMIELARHGWYVDMQRMGLGEPPTLALALRSIETAEEAKEELKLHFLTHLDEIETEVCERFPHRAHILSPAFNAHRTGQYVLSIPVFLSQSDGICFETVEAHYFMSDKGRGRPKTAIHAQSEQHDFWTRIVLAPLGEYGELNVTERLRPSDFSGLNRHTVLHGQSLDYGTEMNSLKAISLLNYVSQVLTRKSFADGLAEGGKSDT